MTGPSGSGKVILLYQNEEAKNIELVKGILLECGVVAIACSNPNNFRFVVPEVVVATQVDLIGRLALQSLGSDKPLATFALAVRNALAPMPVPQKGLTK